MAIDIGKYSLLVSTTRRQGKFTGYWHLSKMTPDGGSEPFDDNPVVGVFVTAAEARKAATVAGTARAHELNELDGRKDPGG